VTLLWSAVGCWRALLSQTPSLGHPVLQALYRQAATTVMPDYWTQFVVCCSTRPTVGLVLWTWRYHARRSVAGVKALQGTHQLVASLTAQYLVRHQHCNVSSACNKPPCSCKLHCMHACMHASQHQLTLRHAVLHRPAFDGKTAKTAACNEKLVQCICKS